MATNEEKVGIGPIILQCWRRKRSAFASAPAVTETQSTMPCVGFDESVPGKPAIAEKQQKTLLPVGNGRTANFLLSSEVNFESHGTRYKVPVAPSSTLQNAVPPRRVGRCPDTRMNYCGIMTRDLVSRGFWSTSWPIGSFAPTVVCKYRFCAF